MEYFDKEFCLEVWGPWACFTRPELKVERVSYDVITPSAARAIFQAIFWKPAIQWVITKIEVLNPIRTANIRRNEVGKLASGTPIFIEDARQQKNAIVLRDVRYRIYAKLVFIPLHKRKRKDKETLNPDIDRKEADMLRKDENPGKYNAMFERRARKGQCFTQPYLGTREFSAQFRLVEADDKNLLLPIAEDRDFGISLYDLDFDANEKCPPALFYHPVMKQGTIIVPAPDSNEIYR